MQRVGHAAGPEEVEEVEGGRVTRGFIIGQARPRCMADALAAE